jgi:threonine dehydratase
VALGPQCWDLACEHVEPGVLSVSDAMLRAALRISLVEMKQAVEPAGAIALAALLSPAWRQLAAQAEAQGAPLRSVAAISCGGNVDIGQLARYCAEGVSATLESHGSD